MSVGSWDNEDRSYEDVDEYYEGHVVKDLDDDIGMSEKDRLIEEALKKYKDELFSVGDYARGYSRTPLRKVCKYVVLESSGTFTTKYSYSQASSAHSVVEGETNSQNALKKLQKERLVVARLGFPEEAFELDKQIAEYRSRAKEQREKQDKELLDQRMKLLNVSHNRKWANLEKLLFEERKAIQKQLKEEEKQMLARQERDFLHLLDNTTRRATGRVKKCNCLKPYLCRHNKTASYNTRKPSKDVVKYRRISRRLKEGGKSEEANYWQERAEELDFSEQEAWRRKVSNGIVQAPWGANDAAVDQMTDRHRKEFLKLQEAHQLTLTMTNKTHDMRRRNFKNTLHAEERKVRMQCRKQAILRDKKDYEEELREEERQRKVQYHSDGLKNISKNLLGFEIDAEDRIAIDWEPPKTAGLDNSVRLLDAFQNVSTDGAGPP
eukprot:gene11295-23634_t